MNCSRFRKVYEIGSEPTTECLAHLDACDECRRFVKGEELLSGLLTGLPVIEAPEDFGRAVRSRIASGSGKSSLGWAIARIALPAAAMFLIVGFVVMNSSLFVSPESETSPVAEAKDPVSVSGDAPGVEQSGEQTAIDSAKPEGQIPSANTVQVRQDTPEMKQQRSDIKENAVKPVRARDSGKVQSLDQASEEAAVTNPPGLDPDREIKPTQRVPEKTFTAKEILGALGVDAEWEDGKLVVGSVGENSIGDRSGVKIGDRIRSIDGRKVSVGTMSKGRVIGKTLKVRRGGKDVTINIRSN